MLCPACDHDNIAGDDLCANCGLDLAGLDVHAWGVDPQDPLLNRPLGELALKQPLTVGPGTSVAEALRQLDAAGEGCVFVVDDEGRPAGVMTERDVVARVVQRGRDPERSFVEDVMTPRPFALDRNDPLAWALHRMGVDGYRHLPVLDGGKLSGFLSVRAVLQTLLEA